MRITLYLQYFQRCLAVLPPEPAARLIKIVPSVSDMPGLEVEWICKPTVDLTRSTGAEERIGLNAYDVQSRNTDVKACIRTSHSVSVSLRKFVLI